MRHIMTVLAVGGLVAWGTLGVGAHAQIQLTATDQQFMRDAHQGNALEVRLGQLAQQQAEHPAVKQFGQHMIQDHSDANQQVRALATNLDVVLPDAVKPEHQQLEAQLSALSGHSFDVAYMQEMVKDHELDVAEYQQALEQVTNPQIRQYVANTLPILQSHLAQARQVLNSELAAPTTR